MSFCHSDFAVGDRVRIRQWDDMVDEFGTDRYGGVATSDWCSFPHGMAFFCGQEYEIVDITPRYLADGIRFAFKLIRVHHLQPDIHRDGWTVCAEMLEFSDQKRNSKCGVEVSGLDEILEGF